MKVALVNNHHPFSGAGKYAFNLLTNFRKFNKNVKMFYLETDSNKIEEISGVEKIKKNLGFTELNKSLLPYFWFTRKIPDGFDVYHATNQFLSKLAKYHKNCVITHMDIRPIAYPYDFRMKMVGVMLKHLLKYYKYAAKILALSEVVKNELLEMGVVEEYVVDVVYPGYDPKVYKPFPKSKARKKLNLPQDAKIVINVGSEEPVKNIPMLINAVDQLQSGIPEIMLVRIGGSKESGKYWEKEIDAKNRINIMELQKIPESEMHLYYNAADVCVTPVLYGEGFLFPPLEAMACGTPSIVSDELKVFEKGSLVVPKDSIEELKDAIYKVLTKNSLSKQLSKKGLRDAKNFTLEKNVKNTYKAYEEIAS
ncbi:MAG: glycosyltransferase family 4 protein [Candidatus Aenigmarchaeota archaeon]|nr:glycosyltransferase family 4 protein [Candidatus Aenigmarchaeota archaeon]